MTDCQSEVDRIVARAEADADFKTRLLADPAATAHERENAKALKLRLERQLRAHASQRQERTDVMFRFGRAIRAIKQSTSAPAPKGDWTDHAFRLGRMLRNGLRK